MADLDDELRAHGVSIAFARPLMSVSRVMDFWLARPLGVKAV